MNTPYVQKNKSRDIWISSDFHLGHENILKFRDSRTGNLVRGDRFSSVDEMDGHILEQHNKHVKQGDIFYTLGDVFMGDKERFKRQWPKFNGGKRLIVGNHDDIKFLSSGGFFSKVQMWRMFPEFGLMLSHVPLHESNLLRLTEKDGKWPDDCVSLLNIHGHIHQNPSPEGPYRNVSVEAIDYTPVHIEDLRVK